MAGDGVLPAASEDSIKKALSLVEFPASNLRDIPGMLRKMADLIESGEIGDITAVVAVALESTGGGLPHVFGFGDTNDIHSIGVLQLGIGFLQASEVRRL